MTFLLFGSAGCLISDNLTPGHGDGPPAGTPSQVNVTWHNQVIFAPDQARGGVSSPGLAGRLYLFGPSMGFPLAGDGSVIVDLFDPSQAGPDGGPKQLERWVLDKDTLHRSLRHDTIGWGYTLLLPWGTYRPDLGEVVLKVRYDPAKGAPIYADASTVLFNPVKELQASSSSRPPGVPQRNGDVVQATHGQPASAR